MGKDTFIEWADSTVNPTSGCDGCEIYQPGAPDKATCYAFHQQTNRLSRTMPGLYSSNFNEVRLIPGRMRQAAAWSDLRGKKRDQNKRWFDGFPRVIFVGDLADIFSEAVPFDYLRREVVEVMASKQGGRHFWILVTKQPQRAAEFTRSCGPLPDNCMVLTSITNQATTRLRLPHLFEIKCRWRGVSAEPLRGPLVDLASVTRGGHLDFVVTGGESGSRAHCPHPDWFRSLRDLCTGNGWPFFFKQWGSYHPSEEGETIVRLNGSIYDPSRTPNLLPGLAARMTRAHKSTGGRLLDGREWTQFPDITTLWRDTPALSTPVHDTQLQKQ
jgi:protein gp37